jgi:AAA domain (Cdc48 subfamily)
VLSRALCQLGGTCLSDLLGDGRLQRPDDPPPDGERRDHRDTRTPTYAAAYLLVGLMLLRRRANTLLIASRHFQRVFHPRCGQLGCNPIEKPLGSFLFLGPIGVGKTELTLEFARYLFGDHHVYRVDMSEFLHGDNVKLFNWCFCTSY